MLPICGRWMPRSPASLSSIVGLSVLLLAISCSGGADELPDSGRAIVHYIERPIGRETYSQTFHGDGSSSLQTTLTYDDRGGDGQLEAMLELSEQLAPTFFKVAGKSYRFVDHDLEVEILDDSEPPRARILGVPVESDVAETDAAEVPLPKHFFTASGYAPLTGRAALIRYWLASQRPERILNVADPAGSGIHVRHRGVDEIEVAGETYRLTRYSVEGVVWGREAVWLDENAHFAAVLTRMHILPLEAVREDLAEALPELQRIALADRMSDLSDMRQTVDVVADGRFAIVGARLVDGTGASAIENATLLIDNGLIVAVGAGDEIEIDSDVKRVEAGGTTILPGLWDMHGHVSQIEWAPAYLAAGVTTVRDMGGEREFLVALRDALGSDQAVGPRLVLAGLIDGEDARSFAMVTASTPEEGRRIVEDYREAGFLQMKLYSRLSPEVVSAVSERAHELGMRVTGHIPSALTLEEALQRGMDEVAHLPLLEAEGNELRSGIALLAEQGTVVDPTLPWNELLGRAPGTAIASFEPGIRYAPSPLAWSYRSVRNDVDEAEAAARLRTALDRVEAMHEAGVALVAGTDGALPGYSLLRSVELFVAAGLSPLEAIQSASSVPAAAMGMAEEVGTIEVGKRADLLIVEGNPLQEISDSRRGRWVAVEGRLYDCAQLWQAAGFRAATDPSVVQEESRKANR